MKRAVGLPVGFVFAIAHAACGLLYLNNEYMITNKKEKKKRRKNDQEIGQASGTLSPPPYISHTSTPYPALLPGQTPRPFFHFSLAPMAVPHQLLPGNTAFGRLCALNSPLLLRSGTPSIDQPINFMARQLAQARSALRLTTQDLPDFNTETLAGTIPFES